MSPEVADMVVEDGVEYALAMEYHGPPITRELPRALPINVHRIPVAAVVSQVPLPDKLSLPVVQPILANNISKKFSKELKFLGPESNVSPTSVIAFESPNGTVTRDESMSKELASGSEITVSPSSVNAPEERGPSNGGCDSSGELSSSRDMLHSCGDYESGELSGMVDRSTGLGSSSVSHDRSRELLNGGGSSGPLVFSDSFEKSRELSGSSSKLGISSGFKESMDYGNDLNQPDWASNDSVLSMDYPSSRVSSLKVGDGCTEPGCDVKRAPVVTFCDVESEDGDTYGHISRAGPEVVRAKKEPPVKVRKGACYRCLKGNRFTEKEVCIVCDAKYCNNCVLRAMGSMPEGRKCVTCIGLSIDESKRGNLGKCSRMLKRLLNDLEIRQIMKSEKLCEVNQLPPEYICVNGRPLCHDELIVLQSCPNPPKKLKPGNYWYDKVSGLWGKEGQKPSQIISPHLNVGGPIKADASDGNTQVYINGREITKVELRMLQLAGVQCAGNPHFWVNEDGSYQEEGQKNTKGYLWGKAGTKLVCAVLSLPVPSKSPYASGDQVNNIVSQAAPDYLEQRALQKFLLIGYSGSGTSTIFKQAKILYKDTPFSEEERENIKLLIQSNVFRYLGLLLEGRERFEEESLNDLRLNQPSSEDELKGSTGGEGEQNIYTICPRLKAFSDWLLKVMVSGNLEAIFPASAREYAPLIEEMWSSTAIQAAYKRRSELEMLPSVAGYFLERMVDILRWDYEPTDVDILYTEGVTSSNGLACVDFLFPEPAYEENPDNGDQLDSLLRFQLIRVQARGVGENCKWLEMFEDVQIVIFSVSLSDYDQFVIDEDGNLVNKMIMSRKFFESIVTHPTFDQMDFLLLLNKFDLFEEKIERFPLTKCEWFDDFHPVMSRHRANSSTTSVNNTPTLGQLAFHYVAVKFKRLFSSLTDRKLYVSLMNGLEPNSVDQALRYAREIVKWDEERPNFSEYSVYSTEAMFRAIGIGYKSSLPSAAALNWVLKDGLGRLSRCIYTASLASAFDTNLKRVRFSTSVLFSLSIGVELLTPVFPSYFLLLASVANIAKQISLACYLATGTAVHRSFAVADNLGEVSAKAQIQTVCFDNLGLVLAAVLNIMLRNNQRLQAALPFVVYPIFSAIDLCGIYQGLKHVHLQTLTKDRLEVIINTWIQQGYIPSPAEVGKEEDINFLWRKGKEPWPIRIGCLNMSSQLPELALLTMQALNNEDFYFVCLERFSNGLPITGQKLQHGIVLCIREGAYSSDVITGLLQACYIRNGLLTSRVRWENGVETSNCSYPVLEEWFKLIEDSKQFAQSNVKLLNEEMLALGWACKNILLNAQEQTRYSFVAD